MFINAVVERIALFPFIGAGWRACVRPRKGLVCPKSVMISCNITWGYVARLGKGRGSNSQRNLGGAKAEWLENSERVHKNG
jgi:hypothetical protein